MSLRFGIVGTGMIAAIHCDAIAAMPGAELTGIMDRGSGRGEALAPGLDTTGAGDLEAFAARGDIDVVTVANPSGAHLDAALAAAAAGLEAAVFVAGEGPLRASLEGSALRLLGQRPDVPALLARADVFVHSSKEEGFGQSVIEAMMAGVPVVATAAGGVPEAVGEAGILVPPRQPDALREALRRALRGEHPPVEVARARARARFSVEVMVAGTEAVYRELAG